MKFLISPFIACIFLGLQINVKCESIKSDSTFQYRDTVISFGYGFFLYASKGERYNNFTTYTSIKIVKDKRIIYKDTSMAEYELDNELTPFFRKLEDNKYEFLIGINDRPNMSFFLHLIINNDMVIVRDSVPESIMRLKKNIGKDTLIEAYGVKSYGEYYGDSILLTGYNPILFYSFGMDGITLDSTKTIKVNTEIYGRFEGYSYRVGATYNAAEIDKNLKMLNLIPTN